MNISALIESMQEQGFTSDQIVAVLKGYKSSNAERQKRYRDRNALRNSVTNKESTPLSPPSQTLPPYTPPKKPFVLPAWVPKQDWQDFTSWRKKIKGGFTSRMQELLLADLQKLWELGHDPGLVLQQSLKNGWKSVYEIKENGANYAKLTGNPTHGFKPNYGKPGKHEVLNASYEQVLADIASGKL